MRTRKLLAAGVAIAALAGSVTPGSAAPVEEIDLTGPGVVRYDDASEVDGGPREVVRGERTNDGGCAFSRPTSLNPGEASSLVEIAYDHDTCRSLVTISTAATAADPVRLAGAGSSSQKGTLAALGDSGPGGLEGVSSAFGRFRAYEWSWFDEPARWARGCDIEDPCPPLPPVNTVKNTIEWTPDGSCAIAPGTSGLAESESTWYTTTGWEQLQNDFSFPASPVPCDVDAYSQNTNRFQNQEFCTVVGGVFGGILGGIAGFVADTDTYYEPNRVRGDENAVAYFNVNWRKDGLCNRLLQFKHKTQNIQIG